MINQWDISHVNNLNELLSIFKQTGFLVLRSFLDNEKIITLYNKVKNDFDRLQNHPDLSSENLKNINRGEMPAHPHIAPLRLEPSSYQHLTQNTHLIEFLNLFFGEPYVWHVPTMFRKMQPEKNCTHLPYHQDWTYNSRYEKMIICAIPLNDCGTEAPSFEFIESPTNQIYPHESQGNWEYGIAENFLPKKSKAHPLVLSAGDIVIFNETTLHRTHINKKMGKTRYSMDARAVPLSMIENKFINERKYVFQTGELIGKV